MTENEFWGRDQALTEKVVAMGNIPVSFLLSVANAELRARNTNDPSWLAHERMRDEMSNG